MPIIHPGSLRSRHSGETNKFTSRDSVPAQAGDALQPSNKRQTVVQSRKQYGSGCPGSANRALSHTPQRRPTARRISQTSAVLSPTMARGRRLRAGLGQSPLPIKWRAPALSLCTQHRAKRTKQFLAPPQRSQPSSIDLKWRRCCVSACWAFLLIDSLRGRRHIARELTRGGDRQLLRQERHRRETSCWARSSACWPSGCGAAPPIADPASPHRDHRHRPAWCCWWPSRSTCGSCRRAPGRMPCSRSSELPWGRNWFPT